MEECLFGTSYGKHTSRTRSEFLLGELLLIPYQQKKTNWSGLWNTIVFAIFVVGSLRMHTMLLFAVLKLELSEKLWGKSGLCQKKNASIVQDPIGCWCYLANVITPPKRESCCCYGEPGFYEITVSTVMAKKPFPDRWCSLCSMRRKSGICRYLLLDRETRVAGPCLHLCRHTTPRNQPNAEPNAQWKEPPEGVVKLNTDAAFLSGTGQA